ncbi:hypothetical protein Tco_0665855 [Tanacetum coccineum]
MEEQRRKKTHINFGHGMPEKLKSRFGDMVSLLCNCLVPPSVSTCKVGIDDKSYNDEYSKEKPRMRSSRFGSSSSSSSSSEKSTLASTTIDLKRSFGTRNFVPPSPFLVNSASFSF